MLWYIAKNTSIQDNDDLTVNNNLDFVLDYFKDKKEIAVDTETTGFDPHTDEVLLYQLGDEENQFVINAKDFPLHHIKPLVEDIEKVLLFQNAKFDLKFFYHVDILPANIYDTFLAETILFTGIKSVRKGLDVLAFKYCDAVLDKSIRDSIFREGITQRVIQYAGDDTKYLIPIKRKQVEMLKHKDLMSALRLDNRFVKVLAYIEYCGIYLDQDKWLAKMKEDEARFNNAERALDEFILSNKLTKYIDPQLDLFNTSRTCSIMWSSSKQVIPLMKDLGVDTVVVDETTGEEKDSVESKVISTQRDITELIPLYLEFKEAEKQVSTYGQNFLDTINPKTGRIHSSFTQILSTGRLSSGGRQGKVRTVNVQNIPHEGRTRNCFTNQKENYSLINGDYSGQEQVILANFSMEPLLLKFYKEKLGDMHSFVASMLFQELSKLPLSTIKAEHSHKRQIAKSAGFAINYGGNGHTIAENTGMDTESGERVYDKYMHSFPGLKRYFEQEQRKALERGYIQFNEVSKRKSYIENFEEFKRLEKIVKVKGFWDRYKWNKNNQTYRFEHEYKPTVKRYYKIKSQISRKAQNYPMQGTAADMIKFAAVLFFDYIVKNNLFKIVLLTNLVHDETLAEAPTSIANEVAIELKKTMERSANKFCTTIPVEADPVIGNVWQH